MQHFARCCSGCSDVHGWARFGFVTGGIVALALGLVPAERPRRLAFSSNRRQFKFRSLLDAGFILVGTFGGGGIVFILYGPLPGALAGVAFGSVFAVVRRLIEPTEPEDAIRPASVLRDDRRLVVSAAAIGWLAGAVVGGLLGGLVDQTWAELPHLGSQPLGAGSPRRCRRGNAVSAALGAMMHSNSASGRFVTTQLWLSSRRLTPVPLIAFLDRARRPGRPAADRRMHRLPPREPAGPARGQTHCRRTRADVYARALPGRALELTANPAEAAVLRQRLA